MKPVQLGHETTPRPAVLGQCVRCSRCQSVQNEFSCKRGKKTKKPKSTRRSEILRAVFDI